MRESTVRQPMASLLGGAVLSAAVLGIAVLGATPAAAKVKCQGIFQVNKNGTYATPLCKDREIARVARSYGWKVTDAQVRNDPLKKVKICLAIGDDNRLKGACGAYSRQNFR